MFDHTFLIKVYQSTVFLKWYCNCVLMKNGFIKIESKSETSLYISKSDNTIRDFLADIVMINIDILYSTIQYSVVFEYI